MKTLQRNYVFAQLKENLEDDAIVHYIIRNSDNLKCGYENEFSTFLITDIYSADLNQTKLSQKVTFIFGIYIL